MSTLKPKYDTILETKTESNKVEAKESSKEEAQLNLRIQTFDKKSPKSRNMFPNTDVLQFSEP